jgi:hypothetical protein
MRVAKSILKLVARKVFPVAIYGQAGQVYFVYFVLCVFKHFSLFLLLMLQSIFPFRRNMPRHNVLFWVIEMVHS